MVANVAYIVSLAVTRRLCSREMNTMMATHVGKWRTRSKTASLVWAIASLIYVTIGTVVPVAADDKLHIVVFGDSLVAGYNLPPGTAFPDQLAVALAKKGDAVRVTNAGVSGDTTSGGLARFDWAVPPDSHAVILELGANDALRGVSPEIARRNLDAILNKLKARRIPVLVAGMRAPANWGPEYVKVFNAMYAELATKHGALLYPFFMEGVIMRADLKLADALHPNPAGVAEVVKRILPSVEKLISRAQQAKAGG